VSIALRKKVIAVPHAMLHGLAAFLTAGCRQARDGAAAPLLSAC